MDQFPAYYLDVIVTKPRNRCTYKVRFVPAVKQIYVDRPDPRKRPKEGVDFVIFIT